MLDFPTSPAVDEVYLAWQWDGSKWVRLPSVSLTISGTAPASPYVGLLWLDTSTDQLMVWDGTEWVSAGAASAVGPTEPTNPAVGDMWFDTTDDSLMIWDGTQWLDTSAAFMPLAGGTFTGPVTLAGDAAQPLQPVTLQQLEDAIAGVGSIVMSDAPPINPAEGDMWWDNVGGNLYIWYVDTTSAQWVAATNVSGGGVTLISDTEPTSPNVGTLWWDTVSAKLFIWDGSQWVIVVNTPGETGPAGPQGIEGPIGPEGPAGPAGPQAPIMGVTDGSNAGPGEVGEYIAASGSGIDMIASGAMNIAQIALTPGDWDVWASLSIVPGSGTTTTDVRATITTTSAAEPGGVPNTGAWLRFTSNSFPLEYASPLGTTRISVAVATTVYLVAVAEFVMPPVTGSGFIAARRVR